MRRKDDLITAFEGKYPQNVVPLWEIHFHIWDKFSKKKFSSYTYFDSLSDKEKKLAIGQNAAIIIEVAEELGFAGVTIPDIPWGCYYTLPQDARLELVRLLRKHTDEIMIIGEGGGGALGMSSGENLLELSYKLFDAPEEVDKLCKKAFEEGIERVKQICDAGVEAVYNGSDIADNRTTWLNPGQLERWYFPYLIKWAEFIKKNGMYTILHTDGNISSILNKIVDTGIQALQAIDPVANMDITKVKKQIGNKICLCGNVDCGLLEIGKPEEIYISTKKILLSCKEGGRFVLGASNAVNINTPRENYEAMISAWRDYGKYEHVS